MRCREWVDISVITYQARVANELARKPEEGLLEVVVRLGRDVVVLEVLLAVEGNGLGLHLALLHVDLVAAEDDGDVLADTDEVTWMGVLALWNQGSTRYQSESDTYGASWERSCR